MADGCRAREVERERRLTHGWSSGDDDHLSTVKAVGQFVELAEAGRDAGHRAVAAVGGLDLLDGGVDGGRQRHVVFGGLGAGDRVDLGLGVVHDVGRVALAGVAELHDARTRVDEATEDRPLRHDARVVPRVGRGRNDRGQRVQVVGAAGAAELAGLDELVGDGDHVGRLTVGVEGEDRLEDQLVLGHVEVGALERLDHIGDGVLREEHASERALLGEQIVRRGALGSTRRRSAQTLL